MQLSLLRQKSELANAAMQREILEAEAKPRLPYFDQKLCSSGLPTLRATSIEVLQINVGKLCNQTCTHCHVDAGPDRRESMSRETAEQIIGVLANNDIPTLDITGGAPEMNPNFRWLVEQARKLGRRVIDRCNLTILMANGFKDLPEFLAEHDVEVVASLPCYMEENCDSQRGDGVFKRSIGALKRLNQLGYGYPGSGRKLTLVYNPTGTSLPPSQHELEATYRDELKSRYDIVFSELHTITNLPISRFLDDLLRNDQLDEYMQKLIEAFNPVTVEGVMCRTMVSVDWQGNLFDCDFNQMLNMSLPADLPRHISDFDPARLGDRVIQTGRHCFGCTAGCGSSCQGAVVKVGAAQ
ncbi:arsenosugar biosynthesis radical SAM (seleno)protein ArsS [Aporhodopirellula aestuarii]|uniref:Arsenosugar biosynthesis radical SAM protein ArsS n=1 Tax=Aporhodopirellula aestuarii TaxID=2950107 RepID=A0ABT0UAS0_9BACT|nr:arsenosugar biosynthesis radical SAM (seleno)protein ArsS [Aporhodopirellula aestuarii]MCM2373964.1 arsenosugar biosynthesis radical SAM protein ArsS [Aporhodopirellula aestuarii]